MKQGKTLIEIAAELERQVATRKDYVAKQTIINMAAVRDAGPTPHTVPAAELEAGVKPNNVIIGLQGAQFKVTEHAHGQISDHLGIPKKYYDKMRTEQPELLARNVNTWLNANPEQRRMLRTLDGNVRAFLSPSYRPLDSFDLLSAALPALTEAKAQIISADVTDTRLYIKALFPEISSPLPGGMTLGEGHNRIPDDVVTATMTISNSEVGAGKLKVEFGCFKGGCTNLMIFPDAAFTKVHVGRSAHTELDDAIEYFTDETRKQDDKAFWMKVYDVVKAGCSQLVFDTQVKKMIGAAQDKIVSDNLPAVVELTCRNLGLATQGLQNSLLKHLIQAGDLSRWGIANAITRAAEDQSSYDDATELERIGGKVLEMSKRSWDTIAVAA